MNTRLAIVAAIGFGALGYTRAAQAQSLDNWGPSTGGYLVQNIPTSDFEGHLLVAGGGSIVDNTCNYHLDMQTDGNLVEYLGPGQNPSNKVWATNTPNTDTTCGWWPGGVHAGAACYYAIFQSDGNFVMYNSASGAIIHSVNNPSPIGNIPSATNGKAGWIFVNNNADILIGNSSTFPWTSGITTSVRSTVSPCNLGAWNGTFAGYNNAHNSGTSMGIIDLGTDPIGPIGENGAACATVCAQISGCVGYNYNSANGHCQPLSSNGAFTQWTGMESGFREAAEH